MLTRIRQYPDHIVVQVQCCPDPEAATVALEASREEAVLAGGLAASVPGRPRPPPDRSSFVSDVLLAPTGPSTSMGRRRPMARPAHHPRRGDRHLVAAGVTEAVITSPLPGPSSALGGLPRAGLVDEAVASVRAFAELWPQDVAQPPNGVDHAGTVRLELPAQGGEVDAQHVRLALISPDTGNQLLP